MISGAPYEGEHNTCMAKWGTCKGPRAKGTEYCIGHLRALERDGWVE